MSRWVEAIEGHHAVDPATGGAVAVGLLRGDGVGPEVTAAAVEVLAAACRRGAYRLELETGPDPSRAGAPGLSEACAEFCRDTFARGGAVLTGPNGGRWVYELRRRFDLFCKISPLQPAGELAPAGAPQWPDRGRGIDILVVREQVAGIYQGRWSEGDARRDGHLAEHSFAYSGRDVRRILAVAIALAQGRGGRLAVVVKRGGIPSISQLWVDLAAEVASSSGVEPEILDIDFAVYEMLRDPARFDVVVAPNLFGDVLADAGGLLLGSRGLCFGASFDDGRAAVYATNHGSAHDLAGSDRANPAAQILAAAAMLRESFGLVDESTAIADAVVAVWRDGIRTDDLAEPGCTSVGTREFGARVADRVAGVPTGERRDPGAGRGARGR